MSGPWEKHGKQGPWTRYKAKSAVEEYNELPWYMQAAQAADDTVRFIANGATLGYADKFAGYMGGEGTEAERAKTARAKERAGSAAVAAELIGSMAPATALAKGASAVGLAGKNLASRTASVATQGGLLGAGQAMGYDEDPLMGAGIGLLAGAGGNLLGEGLTAGVSKLVGILNKAPKTLTPEELKATAQGAYQQADDAGVIFKPEAVNRVRQQVYDDFADFGFHPKNQPGAGVAYDELAMLAEGGNVSLKGMDTARKVAQGGFNPMNPSNNALIGKLTDRIDDFVANPSPADVLTGNSKAAADALATARDYWSRYRKIEKVRELMERAGLRAGSTGSGGNVENATRQELRKLLTDKKAMRGFSGDEKEAIKKVVLGTRTQNVLRSMGNASPSGNGLGKMLWGGLLGGAAVGGGPVTLGLTGLAAAGTSAAKKIAPKIGQKNADQLMRLIAAGGDKSAMLPAKNAFQRLTESQRDTVVRLLMNAGLIASRQ